MPLSSNQLTARGIHKHEGYNFCSHCHETLYAPKVRWISIVPLHGHVTLCVPGVRARAWRRDHRGAEAAGGAGAGGEGEEAQGDRGDAQQKGDYLHSCQDVIMSSYPLCLPAGWGRQLPPPHAQDKVHHGDCPREGLLCLKKYKNYLHKPQTSNKAVHLKSTVYTTLYIILYIYILLYIYNIIYLILYIYRHTPTHIHLSTYYILLIEIKKIENGISNIEIIL